MRCADRTAETTLLRIMSSADWPRSSIGGSAVSKMNWRVWWPAPSSASMNIASYALANCSRSPRLNSSIVLLGSRSASLNAFSTIRGRISWKARASSARNRSSASSGGWGTRAPYPGAGAAVSLACRRGDSGGAARRSAGDPQPDPLDGQVPREVADRDLRAVDAGADARAVARAAVPAQRRRARPLHPQGLQGLRAAGARDAQRHVGGLGEAEAEPGAGAALGDAQRAQPRVLVVDGQRAGARRDGVARRVLAGDPPRVRAPRGLLGLRGAPVPRDLQGRALAVGGVDRGRAV